MNNLDTIDKKNSIELRINPGKGPLGFNLIPPASEEEIRKEIEKDNTLLYSVMLIFASVLIYFVLIIGQTIFIEPSLNSLNAKISSADSFIELKKNSLISFGELISKANLLEEPLTKSLTTPTKFIDIAEIIANGLPINSYERSGNETFSISLNVNTVNDIVIFLERAKTLDVISKPFISSISFDDTKKFEINLSFNIIEEIENV